MRRQLGLVCSILVILFGLIAIVGWYAKIPILVQVHPNFAPMQYNTALCFIGCAVGLLLATLDHRRASIVVVALTLTLSGLTLAQWLTGLNFFNLDQLFFKPYITTLAPHPGRMSMFTAISFVLSSLALLSSASQKRKKKSLSWLTGLLASLVLSISIIGMVGYSAGLTASFSWNQIAQMSLPTVCGFFCIACGIIAIAWRDSSTTQKETPTWLPAAITMMALTATYLLGTAIRSQEHREIVKNCRDNASIVTTALSVELKSRHKSIRRMARRLSHAEQFNSQAWAADALEYTRDDQGYHFIGWTDKDMTIRGVVPQKDEQRFIGKKALPTNHTYNQLLEQWNTHDDVVTESIDLFPDQLSLLTPIYNNGEVDGCILAPFNFDRFFSTLYPKSQASGYHFEVSANETELFSRGNESRPSDASWIQTSRFDLNEVTWQVTLWPAQDLIESEYTSYSTVVISLGTTTSVVLGIAVFLAQLAAKKSSESSLRNIQLHEEVTARIRSRKELEKVSALNNGIILHSAYSVISTDKNGLITTFNPAAENILGYTADEMVGKQTPAILHDPREVKKRANELSNLYGEDIQPGFEVFITEAKRGKTDQCEWTYIRKDGSKFPVTLGITSLLDSEGEIIGYVGIAGDITELKNAESELKRTHDRMMEMSLQVGRAEVATNILHNVGNVLNSVNVSSSMLTEKVRNSKTKTVSRISELLNEHKTNLSEFIKTDRRGQELPEFMNKLSEKLAEEQSDLLKEIKSLDHNIEHIKEIVAMQQGYSKVSDIKEDTLAIEVIQNALRVNSPVLNKEQFKIEIDCDPDLQVEIVKHKVVQILVNLISNSKHACEETDAEQAAITITAKLKDGQFIVKVADNGEGIDRDVMTRIFAHGFTTKKNGHGFGLHGSALAAKQMGGKLSADSDGKGKGAAFTLSIPVDPSAT